MVSTRITELLEGARNCVRGLANVQPGDNVLILVDNNGYAEPLVVEALAIASREAGADVVSAVAREFEPRVEEPPAIIRDAFFAADVVFHVSSHEATLHCRAGRMAIMEYGTKLIPVLTNRADMMCSEWAKFPMDVYWAIVRTVYDMVSRGKTIRVTSPGGTDISSGIHAGHVMGFADEVSGRPGPVGKGDGLFTMFPLGVFGVHPEDPANGVIVYDVLLGIKGLLKEPVRLTIEDHWLTKIEGGEEARWFRKLIDEKKRQGIEGADYFAEIMWGLNPKASMLQGIEDIHLREGQLTRRAGTLHFGIGKGAKGFHWDGVLVRPFSAYIDGEPLIDKGRLTALDDPEVRAIAREFGDPAKLLSEFDLVS